ncbi:neurofilament light polypeptide-like [Brachypodium distachyon]|uniref:neurofilament light polypeptide-like n=1 Tax=Brachypodium distachyon TaxID=15368 RepID=UPI00052FF840|nr:neurofilament light polypeptide-like [Brachypodium distachyon]|eukprot:XP_010236352.1 neurofilament light polypeptide-like [Brachypodium distachyon]
MDWNIADNYEVTSSTLQSARQSPLVGPPPAATPESVSAQMYQARVAFFEVSRSAESCMNKRTATFKTLLAKYKKLEAEHEALKADRESQTGDNAQVAELLKRVTKVQDEKTQLAEQHQEEVARLQAQVAAQAEAHKTEVGQLTSALSTQADEKIRLESEVQKCKGLVAEIETRATAVEREDAEKSRLLKVVRHEVVKIDNMLSKFFPQSVETAQAAMTKVRRKRDPAGTTPFEYDLVDYLVSIASRVKPLKSFGVNMLNAGIWAFRALWPGEEAPTGIPELATQLLEVKDRLNDWRESAARVGADEALSFVLSWYDGINLDVLQSMRAGSPYLSDPELIAKRKERAYSFIQYADVHKFVEGPTSEAEAEMADEDEEEAVDEEIVVESASTATDAPSSGANNPSISS